MTMPFYVSPEHLMKDRADFAQKGISRGRPVVAVAGRDGILLASHNPSKALHKISEIYDRIAFAAVGKYNEFETLRIAGIRYADLRGFSYDRTDVSARGLANAYAQTLGTVFTTEAKPLEVELIVAELGEDEPSDVIYRIAYDGSVSEIHGIAVVGGSGERDTTQWAPGASLAQTLVWALGALQGSESEPPPLVELEVGLLDRRSDRRRTFRRISAEELTEVISQA
ncbi:proteasome subunit alpha [Rarobacter faecitabidus]|uniref:Proteasome alpha subunit n=1 Tax=Rarobacter faecitabidus TaxID=13243 RepID=A0A542ZW05_RARFA|nr:proteasome subunit alpha [Rarobacter faecitabidus]TQL64426.1 proteasome alpha subunit [Rarobacter faecitabidus]